MRRSSSAFLASNSASVSTPPSRRSPSLRSRSTVSGGGAGGAGPGRRWPAAPARAGGGDQLEHRGEAPGLELVEPGRAPRARRRPARRARACVARRRWSTRDGRDRGDGAGAGGERQQRLLRARGVGEPRSAARAGSSRSVGRSRSIAPATAGGHSASHAYGCAGGAGEVGARLGEPVAGVRRARSAPRAPAGRAARRGRRRTRRAGRGRRGARRRRGRRRRARPRARGRRPRAPAPVDEAAEPRRGPGRGRAGRRPRSAAAVSAAAAAGPSPGATTTRPVQSSPCTRSSPLGDLRAHAGRQRMPRAVDLDPRLGQPQRAHRALDRLLERGRRGLRGRLDLAAARHPLRLAPARGQRERAAVLGERRVERVQRRPHADTHAFRLAHRRATLPAAPGDPETGRVRPGWGSSPRKGLQGGRTVYKQVLDPVGDSLFYSSLFALIPIVTLFVLLGGLRLRGAHRRARRARPVDPRRDHRLRGAGRPDAALASEGAAFGLFPIMWIVWTAIWIYNMTEATGHFAVLRRAFSGDLERPAHPGGHHRLLLRRAARGAGRLRHAGRDHGRDARRRRLPADEGRRRRARRQHRAGRVRRDRDPDRDAVGPDRHPARRTSARWSAARRRSWR